MPFDRPHGALAQTRAKFGISRRFEIAGLCENSAAKQFEKSHLFRQMFVNVGRLNAFLHSRKTANL